LTIEPADTTAVLVELHRGLERQGPGDAAFTRNLLRDLPALPPAPRIADLGCGSGAAALALARHFGTTVLAVDTAPEFLGELAERAQRAGLADLIQPIHADMAALDWPAGSLDLLWSEGAAYNLGFECALRVWRPLLTVGGLAVISEMSWFTTARPQPAVEFWADAYPAMGGEAENVERAVRNGFEVLRTQRLPTEFWWRNYYEPLRTRMRQVDATPAMAGVLEETETEITLFERFSDAYGYTFYLMQATNRPAVDS
jgi:SAM-dependent methyltransferase